MNDGLRLKNTFLSLRSKELTNKKLASLLSPRTMMIGDAACLSNCLGYVDGELLEADIPIIEVFPFDCVNSYKTIAITQKHELTKATFKKWRASDLKKG